MKQNRERRSRLVTEWGKLILLVATIVCTADQVHAQEKVLSAVKHDDVIVATKAVARAAVQLADTLSPYPARALLDQMRSLVQGMRAAKNKGERQGIAMEMREFRKQFIQKRRAWLASQHEPQVQQEKGNARRDTVVPASKSVTPSDLKDEAIQTSRLEESMTVHHVPFASSRNTIELTVSNSSAILSIPVASVRVTNAPGWIRIPSQEQSIEMLKASGQAMISFSFSVDRTAPVGKEEVIELSVSTPPMNFRSVEHVRIVVDAPERLELEQNYPNPFNPTTDIQFTIPNCQLTILKVYNVLGQEVATLVNEVKQPGGYEVTWNAGAVPSGAYFCRLQSGSSTDVKKMLLLK